MDIQANEAVREYRCTDCGKTMNRPGTCDDCLIANQPK